jgi:hypothetical protein
LDEREEEEERDLLMDILLGRAKTLRFPAQRKSFFNYFTIHGLNITW